MKIVISGRHYLSNICCAIFMLFIFKHDLVAANNKNVTAAKWNQTALDALRRDLFVNYNKNAQPLHKGQPSEISLGLSVQFVFIDELKGKMTIHAWLKLQWTDEKLSWTPSEYSDLSQIHVLPSEVWHPNMTLFNAVNDMSNNVGQTLLIIYSNGKVLWVPPTVYTSYCSLNLQMWPFDSQTCQLKIGSWSLDYIDLTFFDGIDYNALVDTTEWKIEGEKPTFHQDEYYSYVEFNFLLTRRSSMYTAVIFVPASCLVLLILVGFWLPPQMGEKILLNGIVIVVIAGFLMYFAQLLPVLAENTPFVVLFYSSSLLLTSVATIIAVIVLYLSTAKHHRRVPDFMKELLNGRMGTILCLSQFSLETEPDSLLTSSKELAENNYETPADMLDPLAVNPTPVPVRSIQFDWILLATAIDRIFFVFYCIIFICLIIAYII